MNRRDLQLVGLAGLALYLVLVMVAFGSSPVGLIWLALNLAAIVVLVVAPARTPVALALGIGAHAAMRTTFVIGGRWRWPLHLYDGVGIVLAVALIAAAIAAYDRARVYLPALLVATVCVGAIWVRELYLLRGPAALHYGVHFAALVALTWSARKART